MRSQTSWRIVEYSWLARERCVMSMVASDCAQHRRHAGMPATYSTTPCRLRFAFFFGGGGVGDEAGAQGVKMRRRRQRREGMQSEVSAGSDARTYPEERAVRSGPCDDHNESPRATRTDPDAEDRCHEE